MAKMTLNELKLEIAEILDEAKKKKEKIEDLKKKGAQVEAYGLYDEAFDFSTPLGPFNLYRQQGAVNWGPYTSQGTVVDNHYTNPNAGSLQMKEADERALRAVIREVIQNGLVPTDSAWAPLMERGQERPVSESPWHEAEHLFEAWYDNFKKSKKDDGDGGKKAQGYDKDGERGPVKKHGFEKKEKRGKK